MHHLEQNYRSIRTLFGRPLSSHIQYKWKHPSSSSTTRTTSLILSSCCYYLCFGGCNSNTSSSYHATTTITTTTALSTMTMTTTTKSTKVIDSHLHVWGAPNEIQQYPYVQEPPSSLQDSATVTSLLQYMNDANIDGALLIQPINYMYDHSYILNAMQTFPNKFKGMMLYNPTTNEQSEELAIRRLEELVLAGMVGIRYNPYLFPSTPSTPSTSSSSSNKFGRMSEGIGLKIYQRCATLHIPVGIMCFQGLHLHYDDIIELLTISPETIMILDHFAFTKLSNNDSNDNINDSHDSMDSEKVFDQLIQLSKYPSVHVKISALFRMNDNSDNNNPPYQRIYHERFIPLLHAYSAQRLLYGSDFPYVLEQNPFSSTTSTTTSDTNNNKNNNVYTNTCQLIASWCPDEISRNAILGGNAERLFGPWGK